MESRRLLLANGVTMDLSEYLLKSEAETLYATIDSLNNKQDKLISGTNIKTINNTSILGSGNITIESGNSDANVQAVNTGDILDDVNVDYATKTYVDGLVGDINSVLESIINGGSGVSLITFTLDGDVDGTVYQAEEGMTWGEFIDSEYNINNKFRKSGSSILFDGSSQVMNSNSSTDYVYASDVIQSTTYYLVSTRPD